jgi:hypothetical protein
MLLGCVALTFEQVGDLRADEAGGPRHLPQRDLQARTTYTAAHRDTVLNRTQRAEALLPFTYAYDVLVKVAILLALALGATTLAPPHPVTERHPRRLPPSTAARPPGDRLAALAHEMHARHRGDQTAVRPPSVARIAPVT